MRYSSNRPHFSHTDLEHGLQLHRFCVSRQICRHSFLQLLPGGGGLLPGGFDAVGGSACSSSFRFLLRPAHAPRQCSAASRAGRTNTANPCPTHPHLCVCKGALEATLLLTCIRSRNRVAWFAIPAPELCQLSLCLLLRRASTLCCLSGCSSCALSIYCLLTGLSRRCLRLGDLGLQPLQLLTL
jgi:hypothetical protein